MRYSNECSIDEFNYKRKMREIESLGGIITYQKMYGFDVHIEEEDLIDLYKDLYLLDAQEPVHFSEL